MTHGVAVAAAEAKLLRTAVAALMPHWPAPEDFWFLPGGYSNANYQFRCLGERYVLRLPSAPQSQGKRRREQHFYAHPGGVRVPSLIAMDTQSGAMITRWENGTLLIDASPGVDGLLAFVAHLRAGLDARPWQHREVYDPIARGRQQLASAPGSAPGWVERKLARMRWPPGATVLCHNDLNPWNVIAPSEHIRTWVTLDWEYPAFNDPVFDLVTLHQGLGRDHEELHALAEVLLGQRVEGARIEANLMGFWLREYCWAFARWHQGNQRPEIHAQMRLALARLAEL